MKNSKLSRRLILGCVMVFFYFPILYMLIFSFNGSRSLTSFDGFSLQWYHKMFNDRNMICLLYTSPSPRDRTRSRMPSSA